MAATPNSNATAISEQTIDGFRVIYLGPGCLVASEQTPGAWYHVDPDCGCQCSDHQYRHRTCKHMKVAEVAAELDRLTATGLDSAPDPAPAAPALAVDDAREMPLPGYLRKVMPCYTWGG